MIQVTHLVKKYAEHVAVNDLSFSVEEGQIYGLLGPNGAGKTTTMNIITGYIAATSGQVTIDGIDMFEEPEEAKKRIGYLPELPPVYMDMAVKDYVDFAAQLKGIKKENRAAEVARVMELTGCMDVSGRLIKNLSKGYRQRVGIAQALLGDPKLIILDEPTVGLDPKQIIEIRELIQSLRKKHTVILSSHILSEVSAVCDHIMIISKGKLLASDTPENLAKMMEKGNNQLTIAVKGDEKQITQALKEIDKLENLSIEGTEDGVTEYKLSAHDKQDIREDVFFKLCELKTPILKMTTENISLEDVFLELTAEDHPQEEQAE